MSNKDLTRLPTFDKKSKELVNVVVETPRGTRNKFAYDDKLRVFRSRKVLPAGMDFPYDFGFFPSTKAEDGDPLDALLLMDEPAHPGTLMRCRAVDIIEGEQKDRKGKKERNDRVLVVSEYSAQYAHVKDIGDLDNKLLKALQDFLVNYHELDSESLRVLACKGGNAARKAIKMKSK